MKVDPNCIRDLLFAIEAEYFNVFTYEKTNKPSTLINHTHDSILYHAQQCSDAGLFKDFSVNDWGTNFYITGLTDKGLAALQQLHNDKLWKKILRKSFPTVAALFKFLFEHPEILQAF